MVLDGIDSTQNGNNKKIEELFLPLRATTRNILKATVLDKIWMIARDICNYKGNYMDFSFLTYEELGQCFRKENNIFKEEIKKRKHGCFFYHDNYDKKPVFVYDRNFLSQLGIKEEKIDVDIIKEIYGTVASVGLAKARVYIVNTKEDMQKCRGNFIVVSVSTKPFLTPVMKKAKAIITDEGGLSCHAAILSRELNVPCIIGTKIATKVLKDGDMVEVDANQGIVKKLK
jgi:phosphohistidine swiveling domain-containing protein